MVFSFERFESIMITDVFVSYCGHACTIQKLREELTRALVEAKDGNIYEEGIASFNELVREMTSKRQDVKAFALKTKAMVQTRTHFYFCLYVFYFFCFGFLFL